MEEMKIEFAEKRKDTKYFRQTIWKEKANKMPKDKSQNIYLAEVLELAENKSMIIINFLRETTWYFIEELDILETNDTP